MKAIILDSDGLAFCPDQPSPKPEAGEVLIDVVRAGICETDLQLAKGYMGFRGIPGHEFVGIAESGKFAGQRVVGEINCSCRVCSTCKAGRPTHCPHRSVIGIDKHDGAFAEQVAIPEWNLHAVPDHVGDDQAVFVEPLAAAFQILKQVDVRSSDSVAVLGDGRLGFLSSLVLSRVSDHVTVFGKHGAKLLKFGHQGITTVQVPSSDPAELPRHRFDLVVDCTGSTTGLPMALHLVRPRGTVVMKTTVADFHTASLAAIVIDEIRLVGSRCGPFSDALEALSDGSIDVSDLITDRYALAQVSSAFESAVSPNSFKVVFEISAS